MRSRGEVTDGTEGNPVRAFVGLRVVRGEADGVGGESCAGDSDLGGVRKESERKKPGAVIRGLSVGAGSSMDSRI